MIRRRDPMILLAAGGTGGHVFPAEALAGELLARGHRLGLVTDRRGDAYGGALGRLPTYRVLAAGLAGRGWAGRLLGATEMGLGLIQARALVARLRPAVTVGFGGYASVPPVLAAGLAGRPAVIHEQNAVLGRANRLLSSRVDRLATSFARQEGLPARRRATTVHTGLPVRPAFIAGRDRPYAPPAADAPLRLLVLGGSQGARVFSDVVPDALSRLPDPVRRRLEIVQQCRPEDLERVAAVYAAHDATAELSAFFDDVPDRLAACHLLIARAGASTIAEATCVGRPAILVPYPHAVDDHQTRNAQAVDEAGGGWLMPQAAFTAKTLAERLGALAAMPEALRQAADAARAAGRPDAAARLADLVESRLAAGRRADQQRRPAA